MRKISLTSFIIAIILSITISSNAQTQNIDSTNNSNYSYAYISIEGRTFSKKLIIQVDLGDTPEQITQGKLYSDFLTDRKSYAAVLNYMSDHQYELVNTLDLNVSIYGSGGTSGIIFVMRRKE